MKNAAAKAIARNVINMNAELIDAGQPTLEMDDVAAVTAEASNELGLDAKEMSRLVMDEMRAYWSELKTQAAA